MRYMQKSLDESGQKFLEIVLVSEDAPITYPQQWSAYNEAQTREKRLFMELLAELTSQVPSSKRKGAGRPSADMGDMIFACCLRAYLDFSSRRTESDLSIARELGYLGNVPHFNTLLKYLNKWEMTQVLQRLIAFSALPVKQLEENFAADSTGFSTSMFGRWMETRAKPKDKRLYRKAHVMVGVRTNIIASIEVTEGSTSDFTQFPKLMESLCQIMDVKEVSADKGYSSRQVLGIIDEHGAVPFIPFRSNSLIAAKTCEIWRRMFIYFRDHREEWNQHYHKRSNVESVFSAMKRKQGGQLRCKRPTGQNNEILCKALVHNICVLIQEMFESGIKVDFAGLGQDELMCNILR